MPLPFDSNLWTIHGLFLQSRIGSRCEAALILSSVVSAVRLPTQKLVEGLRWYAYRAAYANRAHVSSSHQPIG